MLDLFTSEAQKAIDISGRFCTAISRYTPRIFFRSLGSDFSSKCLPLDRIHLFCVDECCGSYDMGNKNYVMVTKSLAEQVNLPSENIHRICFRCGSCEYTASVYEQTLYDVIGRKDNEVPRFDLILLKMAPDGVKLVR